MDNTGTSTAGVQTLLRGLAIINAVDKGHHDLKSIGEFTSITRSTTHRLAAALVEQRYLRYSHGEGYTLGSRLMELGARALESTSLLSLARPVLQKLAHFTLDTVHLAVCEDDEVLYLDKINSQRGLEMRSRIGTRMPLPLTGIGKALLLNHSEEEWRTLFLRYCREDALEDFMTKMRTYARDGYAFDLEENEPTIRCVAAPVFDASNTLVAAISVASTTTYMSLERMRELTPFVQACAGEISQELGWSKQQKHQR
ncbi:IclR family transcriptional regulator [Phytobacter massiliensis]|uniref:IclR family transcriptional regulator n=1 Tax=Phytobacter massiliensis TaxID=1485952 RepID=UPI0005C4681F|nr:IclR family transcriptional regulator [Phytobacter massiliensis]